MGAVRRLVRFFALCSCFFLRAGALVDGPWSDQKAPAEWRAQKLLENMTLEEKISMLHGNSNGESSCTYSASCAYVGYINPVPRLGIPPVNMQDGPQGFRDPKHLRTTTAWPSALTMAASFDTDAVFEWGAGMGKEFFDKGSNLQLGPGLCVARVPVNGRNFEYLSGEDPFLGYLLAQPAVRGIQSQKVAANAKHWVMNNQETNRNSVSEEVDERTRYELYYPPFEGAIEGGVVSFMCGYNKINGTWSCENPATLAHDLKEKLGFKGFVMSDWGATHSTSVTQGLDVEQPGVVWMTETRVKDALASGKTTLAAIDGAVTRILWALFKVGIMDVAESAWDWKLISRNVTTLKSAESARRLSAASTVLLKNSDGILPLPSGEGLAGKCLAVIGLADDNTIVHSEGSGKVVPSYIATPLDGIRAVAGAKINFTTGSCLTHAAAVAASCDYAIVFVATRSGEGVDRLSLSLDVGTRFTNQNALVSAVARANARTIVVASTPGAILMPWSSDVAAILVNFMPGQQAGNAIADVLFGRANPSARLPLTFPNRENEVNFTTNQYPGWPNPFAPKFANYSERLLVGYRYYDAHNLSFSTGFPFGHGLSYTNFTYSGLSISGSASEGASVWFTVTNTGPVEGAEVPQLYIAYPPDAGEPPWQLRGFRKTPALRVGEAVVVTLALRRRDFSVWDVGQHAWALAEGTFRVRIGASSRDVRLEGSLTWPPAEERKAPGDERAVPRLV